MHRFYISLLLCLVFQISSQRLFKNVFRRKFITNISRFKRFIEERRLVKEILAREKMEKEIDAEEDSEEKEDINEVKEKMAQNNSNNPFNSIDLTDNSLIENLINSAVNSVLRNNTNITIEWGYDLIKPQIELLAKAQNLKLSSKEKRKKIQCYEKKHKFSVKFPTSAGYQQKKNLEEIQLNFQYNCNLWSTATAFKIRPFKGVFLSANRKSYNQRTRLNNKEFKLYTSIVLNEKIRIVDNQYQINAMIILRYCTSKPKKHPPLPIPQVNMTAPILDDVYGTDFNSFSPSTLDNQLNQQSTDPTTGGDSGNQGFTDPYSQGLVITYGSF